ncbi:CapK protein, putative [Photobacterium marinum]|uniref:CapK protein, putative n=1 Tax=Photobacterium marinum TaxID=1056511 RepID=L8J4L5_9GAMM|nr:phenylacetate--CoA ligase family protein [Photobacterium marinum]ELR63775.1 CapK protein, putative [Photobacterium marinum]
MVTDIKNIAKLSLSYLPYNLVHNRFINGLQVCTNRALLSRDALVDIENERLSILLNQASNKALYKHVINAESLDAYPVINKKTLLSCFEFVNHKDEVRLSTSGSSGEPLVLYRTWKDRYEEQYFTYSSLAIKGYTPGEEIAWLRSYVPKVNEKVIKYLRYYRHWMMSAYDMTDENMDLYYKILKERKIKYIFTYPSSLGIFSEYLVKNRKCLPDVKAIYVSSEMMFELWYKTAYIAFPNSEVLDVYNNVEASARLTSCRECGGYHINNDYGIVEFIGDGKNRKIVGTGFLNSSYPLVRYDTGDLFSFKEMKHSSCKQGSDVVVGKILGRESDIIVLADRSVPCVNIYTVFYKFAEYISIFQLVQVTNSDFVVKYVLKPNATADFEKKLKSELLQRLGDSAKIQFEKLKEIPRDPKTGKHKPIITLKIEND